MRIELPCSAAIAEIKARALSHLRPPPQLTVTQWAEKYRVLSRRDGAQPGRFHAEPHQREIMDCFSDPTVRRVVVLAASQFVGKSLMMSNVIGFYIDQDPANMMILHPTLGAAEKWSKGRLDPMLEVTSRLRGKIAMRKSRDGMNTILHRIFHGGQMFVVGANAPTDLAAQTIRLLLADEVDRYQSSAGAGDRDEGDPIELAEQRTVDYGDFAKIGHFSTPLIAGASRIEASYLESDQRVWECRCPHQNCGEFTELKWQHVEWDRTATGQAILSSARIHCPHCGAAWSEMDRLIAIGDGRWRPTATSEGVAGFRMNALACRRAKLPELVQRWERAQGNAKRLQTFVNLVLGETWQERGEAPEWQRLYDRREEWPKNKLPEGVLLLTGFCDVQKDRLEARVWGWGRDWQSWHIETRIIPYGPERPEGWAELDKLVGETWEHAGGARLKLVRFGIDAGYAAPEVYAWARRHRASQVMVTKGDSRTGAVLGVRRAAEVNRNGKAFKAGVHLWPMNPNPLKQQFYRWLELDKPTREQLAEGLAYPPGYVHLHVDLTSDDEVKQLTAEQQVTVIRRGGFPTQEWQLISGRRNEALDCRVGAQAMALAFGIDRFGPRKWQELEDSLKPEGPSDLPPMPAPEPAPKPAPTTQAFGRPGFNTPAPGRWLGRR